MDGDARDLLALDDLSAETILRLLARARAMRDGWAARRRWQGTEAVLDGSRAVFLPCPPVTRGQEVSAGAMLHPRCRVVEAKAWLLHAQNAVLEWSLGV